MRANEARQERAPPLAMKELILSSPARRVHAVHGMHAPRGRSLRYDRGVAAALRRPVANANALLSADGALRPQERS